MNVSPEQITKWKNNRIAYGMLHVSEKEELEFLIGQGAPILETTADADDWYEEKEPTFETDKIPKIRADWAPRKTPSWVEYDIVQQSGKYRCVVKHHSAASLELFELTSLVGFGGVQYKGQLHSDRWFMCPSHGITQSGNIIKVINEEFEKPATPIKCRFWIEGGE